MKTEVNQLPTVPQKNQLSNETLRIIYSRRAVRKFKDLVIDKNIIDQIIDAGRMAPSALNMQEWKFYVITNREKIKSISGAISRSFLTIIAKTGVKDVMKSIIHFIHAPHDFKMLKSHDAIFHGAPVVIFITAPKKNEWGALDVGMCAQNMMLAAKSMGLDSCPVGLAKFAHGSKAMELLKIPEAEQINLAIVIGYGDEVPMVKERITENVWYI